MSKFYIGIDIGSTSAKTVVLDENKNIISRILLPTGWSSKETSEIILRKLNDLNFDIGNSTIVATGYGRVSVSFANKAVTEITCHGKGANYLFGANAKSIDDNDLGVLSNNLLIIDIGGQDTKIIQVENGNVVDFLMNDKCSAGTGRFLEVMSNALNLKMDELCDMAEKGADTHISSLCTVFAESEVISLIGRGEKRENIAFAIVDSIVKKVCQQAQKLYKKDMKVCLTGGLSEFKYISDSLGKELKTKVYAKEDGRYAGAIGAALMGI
ncbi:MAG: CoA activase [Lachnospiraceae bacterium]|nr:CoA activase [Lachnospiraceae bacterium]